MPDLTPSLGAFVSLEKSQLQHIFDALKGEGYTLVGPTLGDGAIVYDQIEAVSDLPLGWSDRQEPASYRLRPRDDGRYFGFVVGPHSWKSYLFPPRRVLFEVQRQNGSFAVQVREETPPRYAFIGVRACELAAIQVQDRVFLQGPYQDPDYKARRQGAFVLAVNCVEPGGLCFCASMDTGPRVRPGFDLALTELDDIFLIEVGSEMGRQMLRSAPWRAAGAFELQAMRSLLAAAERQMGREVDTSDLPNRLYQNLEHPRWEDVAQRCLSCGNCTQVCPTCFCSEVCDTADLTGEHSTRLRLWDSCFSLAFSHVHGGNIRPHTRSRYRQWLTHKLGAWIDQFGVSGCVGCGRCIVWCPAGIDITAELEALRTEV